MFPVLARLRLLYCWMQRLFEIENFHFPNDTSKSSVLLLESHPSITDQLVHHWMECLDKCTFASDLFLSVDFHFSIFRQMVLLLWIVAIQGPWIWSILVTGDTRFRPFISLNVTWPSSTRRELFPAIHHCYDVDSPEYNVVLRVESQTYGSINTQAHEGAIYHSRSQYTRHDGSARTDASWSHLNRTAKKWTSLGHSLPSILTTSLTIAFFHCALVSHSQKCFIPMVWRVNSTDWPFVLSSTS